MTAQHTASRYSAQTALLGEYADSLLGVFGSPSLVLTHGKGAVVTDADGRDYLDLLAGIAVNALGHAHPRWVEIVSRQLATLGHVSNFFTSPQQIALAGSCCPWPARPRAPTSSSRTPAPRPTRPRSSSPAATATSTPARTAGPAAPSSPSSPPSTAAPWAPSP